MNSTQQVIEIVRDSGRPLTIRINTLRQISDPAVAGALKGLLGRVRSGADLASINYDPAAAERVVDLHIVAALCRLGDRSELGRIAPLVRQAGEVLQGPEDELDNAASVILDIGLVELIRQIIAVTRDPGAKAIENAVIVLGKLGLPSAPVGGDVHGVRALTRPVTFEIHTLSEELRSLAELSGGAILLSPDAQAFVAKHDYDRGGVRRDAVPLADIVERDLAVLGFEYAVEGVKVTVLTREEVARRWQGWWLSHGAALRYEKAGSHFVLAGGG